MHSYNLTDIDITMDEKPPQNAMIIYLDDEPLEHILYGEGNYTPVVVNLGIAAEPAIERLKEAQNNRDWLALIEIAKELSAMERPLLLEQCRRILSYLGWAIPDCPNPKTTHYPGIIIPLMEQIWETAVRHDNQALQNSAGLSMMRLYEYQNQFDKSCQVGSRLLANAIHTGDRRTQASTLNNLGFTYFSAGNWKEAKPLFEQAATLYLKLGIISNHANSLCNYWFCRFETEDWGDEQTTRQTLEQASQWLNNAGCWYERKPLILLARLEEHCGNVKKAIAMTIKAIRSAASSGTKYPEEDRVYLARLWMWYRKRRLHPKLFAAHPAELQIGPPTGGNGSQGQC